MHTFPHYVWSDKRSDRNEQRQQLTCRLLSITQFHQTLIHCCWFPYIYIIISLSFNVSIYMVVEPDSHVHKSIRFYIYLQQGVAALAINQHPGMAKIESLLSTALPWSTRLALLCFYMSRLQSVVELMRLRGWTSKVFCSDKEQDRCLHLKPKSSRSTTAHHLL